jgi:hypothetical protein
VSGNNQDVQKTYRGCVLSAKKSSERDSHWEEWFNNGWFGVMENAMGGEGKVHELFEDGDAYSA